MTTVIKSIASKNEQNNRAELTNLYNISPIYENEKINNVSLYLKRQELSKILFFNEIYSQILNVHGIIIEFGVRWGRNLALFSSLRGIYEPFNHNRKMTINFD